MTMPPEKSMPRCRPGWKNKMMEAVDSTAETISPMNRPFMNWMRVPSGTRRKCGRRRKLNMAGQTGKRRGRVAIYQRETSRRVSIQAVNRLVAMPTVIVTANPRTGPEPKMNSMTCARNAVAFESKIVR